MDRVFPIHTVDVAKKRVGALEDIKNTLNEAGLKEDIMAKVLLSEDAYEKAYKPTVEALMQSNGNVQEAARDSALIHARMIDSLARNYKLPVENIVATIHTNEGFQNGMYGLPAHNVRADGITDIGGYYEEIKKRMSGNNEKLKNVSKITYSTPDGLLIQGERLVHMCKKHGFSTEELMDMERHINSIYNPTVSERYRNGQKGQFGGISVYGLIKGDKDNYFVVISFLENGTIRLETAVKDKDASTYKNKIELSHPMRLTDESAASHGNDNSSISIGRIQKILRVVKEGQYYQKNSESNRKANKKGFVSRYHQFYLPIKAYDKLYTAHIVGEEMKDSMGYYPIDIKLYDLIVNKKANPMQATRSDLRAKDLLLS